MVSLDEKGLGHRLQNARLAAGLTQQGLCQKANLSYSTLAKIERGAIKSPSIFTIENIAEALEITLDELLGREPMRPIQKTRAHSKSGVQFVYFDVNGCIVRSYQRAFGKLAHDSGQPVDVVETFFWHYNDLVCRSEMTLEAFNSELATLLHMDRVDWAKYYLAEIEPMSHMDEVVRWVGQHYGVGLMTNIMPGLLAEMRQREIIPDLEYDAVIDSSEIHAIKPEAKIYQVAIERANLPAEKVLFIDDSRANIMAAEKSGMHVLWFDDSRPEESAEKIKQALEPATDENQTGALVQPVIEPQSQQVPAPTTPEPEVVHEVSAPMPPVSPAAVSPSAVPQNAEVPVQW